MPIKFIGRKTTFKGKSLWEIVGNLKNYGVGRMVIRSQSQRYPEASYMRILKVAALPNPSDNCHDPRKVVALVERTFRGETSKNPVQIDSVSYKSDYVLIPKDQEARYLTATNQRAHKLLPATTEFPPLLKEILIRQANQAGELCADEPKLQLKYNFKGMKIYRLAKDGETPTVHLTSTSTKLYKDVARDS